MDEAVILEIEWERNDNDSLVFNRTELEDDVAIIAEATMRIIPDKASFINDPLGLESFVKIWSTLET